MNELEHWLHEHGYSERVVRQEILKARKISRNELLKKEVNHQDFNITYYASFQNTKTILEELQILLAPYKEHQEVFPNIPIAEFRNVKSLKDLLETASLPTLIKTLGSDPCGKRNCQVC